MFFHIILSFSRYFIFYYYVILSRSRVCDVFLGNEFRVALETVYLISVYILQLAQLYCRYFINVPLSLSLSKLFSQRITLFCRRNLFQR